MHSATKVLMGTVRVSREAEPFDGSPATYLAGLAVRLGTDGALGLPVATGGWAGISLGKGLSNTTKRTNVARSGTGVPVLLTAEKARGTVTITSVANLLATTPDSVTVGATIFTAQSGAATLGQTTFRAATGVNETATSLAAQINAHATAGALVHAVASSAIVTIIAKAAGTGGNAIALAYTDNHSDVGATVSGSGFLAGGAGTIDYAVIGAKVYFNDVTGLATQSDDAQGATVSDAVYVTGAITGVAEDGTEVVAAIVDMPGGL